MALAVMVEYVTGLKGTQDRFMKLRFRGDVRVTKVFQDVGVEWRPAEMHQWSVESSIDEHHDVVVIELYNKSRLFAPRLFGKCTMKMPGLIPDKTLFQYLSLQNDKGKDTKMAVGVKFYYSSAPTDSLAATLTTSLLSPGEGQQQTPSEAKERKALFHPTAYQNVPRCTVFEDWQVYVRVVEAKDLAGLRIDPYIEVTVGDKKDVTETKHENNNPQWEETFVYDFKLPKENFLDQVVKIQAFNSSLVKKKPIGRFLLDLWHVYESQGHGWSGKWAVLNDKKTNSVKGYVKVDIFIKERGSMDTEPEQRKSEHVDRNLLLPRGVRAMRSVYKYQVHIYKATALPKLSTTLISSLKKQFTGKIKTYADSYVEVSFAGMTARTNPVPDTCSPVFYKTITFHEFFPSMCRRMRIRVRDGDSMSGESIATHFIDMKQISYNPSDGNHQFIPSFGPSYVHLYGSLRDYSFFDENLNLNDGVGDGISYRGRLLIAVTCEESSSTETGKVEVENMEDAHTTEEGYQSSEFVLFATLYEASMINRRYEDKPVHFEISIGEFGYNNSEFLLKEDLGPLNIAAWNGPLIPDGQEPASLLGPFKTKLESKKEFLNIALDEVKPCMNYSFTMDNQTARLLVKSMIRTVCLELEKQLNRVQEEKCRGLDVRKGIVELWKYIDEEKKELNNRLAILKRSAKWRNDSQVSFKDLVNEISAGINWNWNDLDGFLLQKKIDELKKIDSPNNELNILGKGINNSKRNKSTPMDITEKQLIDRAKTVLQSLKTCSVEPQHSLPDVFVWMISGGRRVCYARIPAEDIFFSSIKGARGCNAGKLQTVFLQLPEKRGDFKRHWKTQVKLDLVLWLGTDKDKDQIVDSIPTGHNWVVQDDKRNPPPAKLQYTEHSDFIFRAHMFQGRGLFGSDDSGFSDPFAKVIIGGDSQRTTHRRQTRNPTWNHMLRFDNVKIPGNFDFVLANPPVIVVEVYDKDPGGEVEIIGKAIARPYVKAADEEYKPPNYPPPLDWFPIYLGERRAGDLLASFELLEFRDNAKLPEVGNDETDGGALRKAIPKELWPQREVYRIEVLFWGVREVENMHVFKRPQVRIGCCYPMQELRSSKTKLQTTIYSNVCTQVKQNPNFGGQVVIFDVQLPQEDRYKPPLTLSVVNQGMFESISLVGSDLIYSVEKFVMSKEKHKRITEQLKALPTDKNNKRGSKESSKDSVKHVALDIKEDPMDKEEKCEEEEKMRAKQLESGITLDWWTRFNTSNNLNSESIEEEKKRAREKGIVLLKIYHTELEKVEEFGHFKDFIQTFYLRRGKMSDQQLEETRIIGKVKAALRIWRSDTTEVMNNTSPTGTFLSLPSCDPFQLLVRVYCIRAYDLVPADPNGKADPYVSITVGRQKKTNREEAVIKSLNPEFGKCLEFEVYMPFDSMMTVRVMDYDYANGDDLIGKTEIDLEDRYYSRHRATCGLQETFARSGYAKWRDPEKPTMILSKLCKKEGLPEPVFKDGYCEIEGKKFPSDQTKHASGLCSEQDIALLALQDMKSIVDYDLVPEHVETRILTHPGKGGVPQGKIQMWVDMFRLDESSPPPPVDISLRKPEEYELRVIVWNTERIAATDNNPILGIKSSDIFVKGWLEEMEHDKQETDVHYRSTNGVGMFNWRFVFPVKLHIPEAQIVVKKKLHFYDIDPVVEKKKPLLHLQVWDADIIFSNNFLGRLTLDLFKLKPPAKSAKQCSLKSFRSETNTASLVKCKKTRGWWPFESIDNKPAGAIEAELELIPLSEAETRPVGKKRSEPESLAKPDRPADSVSFFLGPLRVLQLVVCNHKGCLIKTVILFVLGLVAFLFFYAMPGYSVKKLFKV